MNEVDQEELKRIEVMKKTVLNKILTKEAIERLGRLKLVKPDLTNQLEMYLIQSYQEGKLKEIVTDEQIKTILNSLTTKREFKIKK